MFQVVEVVRSIQYDFTYTKSHTHTDALPLPIPKKGPL